MDIERSIGARFADMVRAYPDRLAIKAGDHAWTYTELDRRANAVAHRLRDRRGEPVGVLLEQGAPLAVAILGVLKSGNFYVPIGRDPLVADVLAHAGARVVLADGANRAFASSLPADLLELDDGEADDPGVAVGPDDYAYIYYTSGSTGRPKGVVDTHRNVLHNIRRYTNSLGFGPDDRLTLLQHLTFSGAVSSLFGALLNGAAVFPFDVRREGVHRVAAWLARERITIYHSVPALFRLLTLDAVALPDVRVIRLEGDQASRRDVEIYRRHFADDCILVNGLGATECGLVRQYFVDKDTPVEPGVLPIGQAVEGMEILILDGEIAVRSRYLSLGYWQRPDLTARAFADGVYRTGDLGFLRPDGCLEYRGRKDGLRKVRGQWIDTAAVETALLTFDRIEEAVAEVREHEQEARLVAYLVGDSTLTVGEIRRGLARTLPEAMVPTAFVFLESLPLTPNGKVDRRGLPAPAPMPIEAGYEPPRTELEQCIAARWAEVLKLERAGIDDNFFDLGGDSIRATLLANRLWTDLGVDLGLAVVFEHPTIRALARYLDQLPR